MVRRVASGYDIVTSHDPYHVERPQRQEAPYAISSMRPPAPASGGDPDDPRHARYPRGRTALLLRDRTMYRRALPRLLASEWRPSGVWIPDLLAAQRDQPRQRATVPDPMVRAQSPRTAPREHRAIRCPAGPPWRRSAALAIDPFASPAARGGPAGWLPVVRADAPLRLRSGPRRRIQKLLAGAWRARSRVESVRAEPSPVWAAALRGDRGGQPDRWPALPDPVVRARPF